MSDFFEINIFAVVLFEDLAVVVGAPTLLGIAGGLLSLFCLLPPLLVASVGEPTKSRGVLIASDTLLQPEEGEDDVDDAAEEGEGYDDDAEYENEKAS